MENKQENIRKSRTETVKSGFEYARAIGAGGYDVTLALAAAFRAGLAVRQTPTPEKPEQPKKEG